MDFKKIAAALVLLPFFIWLIGWAPPILLLIVIMVLGIGIGFWEYTRIVFGKNCLFETIIGWITSGITALAVSTLAKPEHLLALLSAAFLVISISFMFREQDLSKILENSSKIFFGTVLLGLFGGMIVALRLFESSLGGFKLVILLFALVWINDAGAYFAGSLLGKNKIAPKISPNKTIEGSIGGFAATILLAMIIAFFTDLIPIKEGLMLGIVMGVVGPLGDLFESAMKRGAGVKDSGNLIPGHGGILDRVDSILFGAPIIYFYVLFRFF